MTLNFSWIGNSRKSRNDSLHHTVSYVIHKPMVYIHFNDAIMGKIASQITSLTIVYSTVYSDADQGKHQSSASLAFVRGIHRGPVNSPHKGPVTRKMFPFDDVIMLFQVVNYLIASNATRSRVPCVKPAEKATIGTCSECAQVNFRSCGLVRVSASGVTPMA